MKVGIINKTISVKFISTAKTDERCVYIFVHHLVMLISYRISFLIQKNLLLVNPFYLLHMFQNNSITHFKLVKWNPTGMYSDYKYIYARAL